MYYEGKFPNNILNEQGVEYPLAFVYENTGYYFLQQAWSNEQSCGVYVLGKQPYFGIQAHDELVGAIKQYNKDRKDIEVKKWFKDHFDLALSTLKE